MDIIAKYQIDCAVYQLIMSFMKENNIPASAMEDAIGKTLLDVKHMANLELAMAYQKKEIGDADERE